MTNIKINFLNIRNDQISKQDEIKNLVNNFINDFDILERNNANILTDNKTGAFYIECNIIANKETIRVTSQE